MKARRRRYSIKRITDVYTPTKFSSSILPEEMTETCKKGMQTRNSHEREEGDKVLWEIA